MIEPWGETAQGETVQRITLQTGPLCAKIITLGASLQDLRLTGFDFPLVLGYRHVTPYLSNPHRFGSTIARYANRIRHAQMRIDGQTWPLSPNVAGGHQIHGGERNAANQNWRLLDAGTDHAHLRITLPDGEMGFPGNLQIDAIYKLVGHGLALTYRCRTDQPTLCRPTHHSYFNLDGQADLRDHHLALGRTHVFPKNSAGFITGPAAVEPRLDFENPTSLRRHVELDHCFEWQGQNRHAHLYSAHSGLSMMLNTNQPTIQAYAGGGLQGDDEGLLGRPYGRNAGIALEPHLPPIESAGNTADHAILYPDAEQVWHTDFTFQK